MGGYIPEEEDGQRNHTHGTEVVDEKGKQKVGESEEELAQIPRMQDSPVSMTRLKTSSRVSFRPSNEIARPVPLGEIEDGLEGPTANGPIDSEKNEKGEIAPSTGLSQMTPASEFDREQGECLLGPHPKLKSTMSPWLKPKQYLPPSRNPREANIQVSADSIRPNYSITYSLNGRNQHYTDISLARS
jgi:hypothetical protein